MTLLTNEIDLNNELITLLTKCISDDNEIITLLTKFGFGIKVIMCRAFFRVGSRKLNHGYPKETRNI